MVLSTNEKSVLYYLASNPLASNHTIATYMNIHHATVSGIRKKLEDTIGLSYRVDINPGKGLLFEVFVIYFSFDQSSRNKEEFDHFCKLAEKHEGVVGMGLITHGKWDGWLRVVADAGRVDSLFFLLKKNFGKFVNCFEIVKLADCKETGAQNMKKLVDML